MVKKIIPDEDLQVLKELEEQAKLQDPENQNIMWNISGGNQVPSEEKPVAIILGGQPGAGKTSIFSELGEIAKKKCDLFVQINGDAYRAWHPALKEICDIAGEQHPNFTQSFVGRMVQASLNRALKEKKSFIVEGTFRTFETPNDTILKAKDAGYEVIVAIKTCPKEISRQRTVDRFKSELDTGFLGARPVDPAAHDQTVLALPSNADKVLEQSKPDRFLVFNDNQLLFDSSKDKGRPSNSIKTELNRNDSSFKEDFPSLKVPKNKITR